MGRCIHIYWVGSPVLAQLCSGPLLKTIDGASANGVVLSFPTSTNPVSRKQPQFDFQFQKHWWVTGKEMIFLSWTRPSHEDQKACINKSDGFNYEAKYRGKTAESASSVQQDSQLRKNGFSVNHARSLVGSGLDAFEKGKLALKTWRHFGLDWAFVDPRMPIQSGSKFCVCEKEFIPWLMMPLQVVYVKDNRNIAKNAVASFSFGSGTLKGHLLAGEERFSITLDEDNQVWYEILSFSRPAHVLSLIGYPYVLLRQRFFAHQSSIAVRKHLSCK